MAAGNWQEIAAAKRAAIISSIPKEYIIADLPTPEQQPNVTGTFMHQYLSEREIEITETDAVGILAKTTTGAWTATEVTKAFIHRASIAHQLTNCLHETAFPAALATATSLDAHFTQHRTPLGPLHGLPISLKDQFHIRDLDTSMGYIGWLGTHQGRPRDPSVPIPESVLVTTLRALGAVIYVKTAVPHTLMCGETVNNIVGAVPAPGNRVGLSAGGSSGGEGALIALRGSPLGFGTDIGGSVRIPAAFNGLCGLRPSAGRLPYGGVANSLDGQNSVLSVVGPLARNVVGLEVAMRAVLGAEPWGVDPGVLEIPWREEKAAEVRGRKLVFGVLRDDGIVQVTPPVRRAIELVVEKVKAAGHEVIDWHPPSHADLLDCCAKTWLYDGGRDTISAFALSGEPQHPHVAMPYPDPLPEVSASAIAANNVRHRELKERYLAYWNSTPTPSGSGSAFGRKGVDALITPVAPFPAARPGRYKYYGYSMWVNLLDYAAAVVPVTRVDGRVDVVDAGFVARSELDKETQETWDPVVYEGAPVDVQVVGRRGEEERVVGVAGVVEGLVGFV